MLVAPDQFAVVFATESVAERLAGLSAPNQALASTTAAGPTQAH